MKIVIIIPFYKRLDLTDICFREIKKQGCDVYTVGSEGDESKSLAEKHGFNYIEFPNNPVSNKHNALTETLRYVDFDYAILVGSDNFVSANFIAKYTSYLKKYKPLVSQLDGVYFYNQNTKDLTLFKGFTGVGRAYSRELLERFDFALWHEGKNSGLDTSSLNRMREKGIEPEIISIDKLGIEMLDVKYSTNITSHEIVNLGEKVDKISIDLSMFDVLTDYSAINLKKIIKKEPMKKTNNIKNKRTVIIIKDGAGIESGTKKILWTYIANQLVADGIAVFEGEEIKPQKQVEVKKIEEKPCTDCKDKKPCKGCEESAETTNLPTRKRKAK